jgi:hypothetical protein
LTTVSRCFGRNLARMSEKTAKWYDQRYDLGSQRPNATEDAP